MLEEMKCPYCGTIPTETEKNYFDWDYEPDGNNIDVVTWCECSACQREWKYINRYALTSYWNER